MTSKVLGRIWLPMLVVVAVAAGALVVVNVRSIFGSNPVLVTPKGSESAADFNPKVVTYEVFGSGSSAVVNYLDLDGKPQRVETPSLPWTLTLTTTSPSASANILAQGDGHTITCRVTVDDEVKAERTATGMNAETFCYVKSA
ncbi:MAG: hypothetical protein HYZ38_17315 [Mycobacterium sp.]|nr:hypothetical protein [Mycobacterium sp.]